MAMQPSMQTYPNAQPAMQTYPNAQPGMQPMQTQGRPMATSTGYAAPQYGQAQPMAPMGGAAPQQQSWFDWMMGHEPPKTPMQIRCEKYVSYVVCMEKIFTMWEAQKIGDADAMAQVNQYMSNIQQIGRVDGEQARALLQAKGIDDQRRMDLQAEYADLCKRCGQHVTLHGNQAQANAHAPGQPRSKHFLACCAA
eukprot:TRINITY_DN3167_c0_g1_i1.p2 TRINITY_DN3167_c0_g1~~TRINITY_DN3167_c0_g1_i1.p2  ORF type:complete len:214 (+),score=56.50 TRINITY_DN3167_c0_g1_i1:59-643(+)